MSSSCKRAAQAVAFSNAHTEKEIGVCVIPHHLAKLNRCEVEMFLAGDLGVAAIPRVCIVVEAYQSVIPPDNEILRGFEEYYDSDHR